MSYGVMAYAVDLDLIRQLLGSKRDDVLASSTALVFGGSAIPLPPIDDFPVIGHLSRAAIPRAHTRLSAIDPERFPDRDIQGAVLGPTTWLSTCREKGVDLVSFYC